MFSILGCNRRFVGVTRANVYRLNHGSSIKFRRLFSTEHMRNIAIVAHVDHGKTTLVDSMFQFSSGMETHGERVMDSNALEKERGITILSKCTSMMYDNGEQSTHLNIVDTPGHADFGGEVERIMTMVDGVALVVDASEGPMTQTKFVLSKALQKGLKPLVVINKVDRSTNRVGEVETELFDLFADLDASDEQLDFPILYASGRDGWATDDPDVGVAGKGKDMKPLFDLILSHVPPPKAAAEEPFAMMVTQIFSNKFFGKCLLGRVSAGKIKVGDPIKAIDSEGNLIEETRVFKIITYAGLEQVFIDDASGGQIVAIAGFKKASVNHTLCDPAVVDGLESVPIDPPTVCMTFAPNDSPFIGQEGNAATSAMLWEWLEKEAETNVSIVIRKQGRSNDPLQLPDGVQVFGRGELQLGIIIETMRREGYELSVGPPAVVFSKGEDDEIMEPIEDVHIECSSEFSNLVVEKMNDRKAEMVDMVTSGATTRLNFLCPTRGLMGYRNEFLNDTRGTGVINYIFHGHEPYKGDIKKSSDKRGAMIATEQGPATAYALDGLQARGTFFIEPGFKVYPGMIIGDHSKGGDLECNPVRGKQLTNMRSTGKDDKAKVFPALIKSLEQHIADIRDDEVIEVTTKHIRLRKRLLESQDRKKLARSKRTMILNTDI